MVFAGQRIEGAQGHQAGTRGPGRAQQQVAGERKS